MNPRDFLDVADEWATGSREAEWRSAVSRAYYAVHHVARRLLSQCGFIVPVGDQAHAFVWLRLCNCGQPDLVRLGNDLNYLRGLRNWADYDLDQPFQQRIAVHQVQTAGDMIDLLEDVARTPTVLVAVMNAIKTYERDVLRQETWRS